MDMTTKQQRPANTAGVLWIAGVVVMALIGYGSYFNVPTLIRSLFNR